jgi:trypsin
MPPSKNDQKLPAKSDVEGGDGPGTLIVGGLPAANGRYPYMVNLNGAFGDNYCGGTLIAPTVVLSAAHCMGASEVTIGRFNIATDGSNTYDRIPVAQEVRHPFYNSGTMENDIMLIRLTRASSKPTVAINWSGSANVNQMLTVMGWGTLSEGGNQPDQIRYVDVPYVSNSACNYEYSGGISDDMMCAGFDQGGKDACQGDSGGPLIISGGVASKDVQVGVVSWGDGCGKPTYPGVYSRISESWTDFLQSQLRSWSVDLTTSPAPAPVPSPGPAPPPTNCFECKDSPTYLVGGNRKRGCAWVALAASKNCKQGANVIGCPKTCGVCK